MIKILLNKFSLIRSVHVSVWENLDLGHDPIASDLTNDDLGQDSPIQTSCLVYG